MEKFTINIKYRFIKIILIVLFSSISICNCSKKHEEYYPLNEGMSWEYTVTFKRPMLMGGDINTVMELVNFPERKLEKAEVIPQKYTIKDPEGLGEITSFEFIGTDSEGIFTYAEQSSDDPDINILEYRRYLIKHSMKVSDIWKCIHRNYNSTSSLLSIETVTVPAGNFKNCLKIKEKGIKELDENDFLAFLSMLGGDYSDMICFESIYWYAPNVGMVKFYQSEQIKRRESKDSWDFSQLLGDMKMDILVELKSYSKKGKRQILKKMPLISKGQKKRHIEDYITPEVLGKNILDALRRRDIDHFMNFVVNQQDLEGLSGIVFPDTELEEEIRELYYHLKSIKKTFLETSALGITNGINWELTKFESVQYEVNIEDGIEASDIYLVFSYNGIKYIIQIDDCIKAERGWVNFDGIRWDGKIKGPLSDSGKAGFYTGTLEVSGERLESFFSFNSNSKVFNKKDADLILYFDNDDCSRGALFGYEDDEKLIYPLGKKIWKELVLLKEVPKVNPINAIMPITSDKKNDSVVIKRKDNSYAIVRLYKIRPSTYKNLKQGSTASIEFEWALFKQKKDVH